MPNYSVIDPVKVRNREVKIERLCKAARRAIAARTPRTITEWEASHGIKTADVRKILVEAGLSAAIVGPGVNGIRAWAVEYGAEAPARPAEIAALAMHGRHE